MAKFDKITNCRTCKFGYFEDVSDFGHHNLCGRRNCYLCAADYGECADYGRGTPPKGKEEL